MTLKDHVEIIDNPVVMAIEEKDGTVLYRGYKGCFGYKEDQKSATEKRGSEISFKSRGNAQDERKGQIHDHRIK